MRIRSVKPEFWQSETISSVDAFSRLMAIALLNLSDDHGYFNATPAVVRGEVFPFEESLANVSRALAELSRVGYICIGTTSTGKRVGRVVNFKMHQKVDHPSRLTFDVDSIIWDEKTNQSSRDPRETVASPRETLDHEHGAGSGERGAGSMEIQPPIVPREQKPKAPPTEQEVLDHCKARRSAFSPSEFDHLLSDSMRGNSAFLQAWHDWNEARHDRRKRITEAGAKQTIRDMHAHGIQASIEAIRAAIASDWQGIHFREQKGGSQACTPSPQPVMTFDDIRNDPNFHPAPKHRKTLDEREAELAAEEAENAALRG